jgi:hypothetical protein
MEIDRVRSKICIDRITFFEVKDAIDFLKTHLHFNALK